MGVLFGGLTRFGLPVLPGAVLTVGISYSFASQVKGSISSYVGLVSAVEMFDRIRSIGGFTDEWLQDIGGVAGRSCTAHSWPCSWAGWWVSRSE